MLLFLRQTNKNYMSEIPNKHIYAPTPTLSNIFATATLGEPILGSSDPSPPAAAPAAAPLTNKLIEADAAVKPALSSLCVLGPFYAIHFPEER